MFDIGPFEMVALIVIAIIVFGPEKLPRAAADAARMLRQVRRFAQGARADLTKELGPEFDNINLRDLHPRTFVRDNLLRDNDLDLDLDRDLDLGLDDDTVNRRSGAGGSRLKPGERPPYDTDAT